MRLGSPFQRSAPRSQVAVPGRGPTTFLHSLLQAAVTEFHQTFSGFPITHDPDRFGRNFAPLVEEFEARRIVSPERVQIAAFLLGRIREGFTLRQPDGGIFCLPAAISRRSGRPQRMLEVESYGSSTQGLKVELPYNGRLYSEKGELLELADRLFEDEVMTREAAEAVKWIVDYAFEEERNGFIKLDDRLFGIMGPLAEMLDRRDLLKTGASVAIVNETHLLTQPAEIAAAFRLLAERYATRIDFAALAKAPGVEWNLMASMMAIVEACGQEAASLAMYLSPTMVTEIAAGNFIRAHGRYSRKPEGERSRFEKSAFEHAGRYFGRFILPALGTGDAGAELTKIWTAEVLGTRGTRMRDDHRITVSANMAPMTLTHSAFKGPFLRRAMLARRMIAANASGFYIADAAFSRRIMLLLWLQDLLNPKAPGHASQGIPRDENRLADRILEKKVHAGAATQPYNLRSTPNPSLPKALRSGRAIFWHTGRIRTVDLTQKIGAGTWILPADPLKFEEALEKLDGPLASAFVLFEGRRSGSLAQTNIEDPTRRGFLRGEKPLTRLLFGAKGPDDFLTVTVDREGTFQSVRLRRPGGQDLEIQLLPERPPLWVKLIFHHGRLLPDGSGSLEGSYFYAGADGLIEANESSSVGAGKFLGVGLVPRNVTLGNDAISSFKRLTGQGAADSLIFPANAGLWDKLWEQLRGLFCGLDLWRTIPHELKFVRGPATPLLPEGSPISVKITPYQVIPTDRGEEATILLDASTHGTGLSRLSLSFFLAGNAVKGRMKEIVEVPDDKKIKNRKGSSVLPLILMNDREIFEFAALNRDSHPAYFNDDVARFLGLDRRIVPPSGTLARIEAALRGQFTGKALLELTGKMVAEASPGETCRLEFAPSYPSVPGMYIYQLIAATKRGRRVVLDGQFRIGDLEPEKPKKRPIVTPRHDPNDDDPGPMAA